MNIKWIKPAAKFNMGYFVGDICEIEDKKAAEIIAAGYADEIESNEVKEVAKPKKTAKK